MVPETRSDRIFCHSMLFFALLPPKNLENQNFLKMKKLKKHLEMSSFSTNNLKNQNFEKIKQTTGDIITLR